MRISLIGDSQMEGLAPHLTRLLEAKGHDVVATEAHRGWSTGRFIENWTHLPESDLAIVALGGNDRPDNEATYRDRIRMFESLLLLSKKVIWWGPAYSKDPYVQARHLRVANMQRRIVPRTFRDLGGGVITVVRWYDSMPVTRYLDGVTHFNRAGYEKWSKEIVSRIDGGGAGLVLIGAVGLLTVVLMSR